MTAKNILGFSDVLLEFCEIFKNSTKLSSQVNDELIDLIEMLEDVENFPERYTSVQLVEELKKIVIGLPINFLAWLGKN